MRAAGFFKNLNEQIEQVRQDGLYKSERIITSQQKSSIDVGNEQVLNFCANNYLGLANSKELIDAAHDGLNNHGSGVTSVRFICGT